MELDSAVFYSHSIPAAVEYYTGVIGLELDYRQGDDYAAFFFSNGLRLGIKRAVEAREIPGSQTVVIATQDARGDYDTAQKKGLDIHHPLSDDPWGIWFSVLDPDKNLLEYLQRK